MVHALSEGEGGESRGGVGRDKVLAAALGENLHPLARQYPRLVHFAPDMVGAQDSRMVQEGRRKPRHKRPRAGARLRRRPLRPRELDARRRLPRHVGELVDLAVRDDGLAGRRQNARARNGQVLPHLRPRHGPRHHILLGRPNDNGGPRISPGADELSHTVQKRILHGHHTRHEGAKNVKEPRQLPRSPRHNRPLRGGRTALRRHELRAAGAGHTV